MHDPNEIPNPRAAMTTGWWSGPLLFLLLFVTFLATLNGVGGEIRTPDATHEGGAEPRLVVHGLGIEMIWVKPGNFTMGSDEDEPFRNKAEGPQMKVTISKGFWLGKTEITQGQYEMLISTNPSAFKMAGTNAPAETVSWLDAKEFCRALNAREKAAGRLPAGRIYTLPTEAQWEYACRAGTTGSFPGDPETMSWYDKNSGESTHPVGILKPNAWGFHDMGGNVLEWCSDWYGPYPGGSVTDPKGPGHGYYRMARGGSWRMESRVGRSAARAGGSPGRLDYTLGFRLALCAED